jgi:heme o synthase
MKPQVQTAAETHSPVQDWLMLVRPRVAVMVAVVTWVGAFLGSGLLGAEAFACLEAAVYVTLVTACASILNQVLERETDGLMNRTKHRPLVNGRIAVSHALLVAVVAGTLGTLGLALQFNMLAALLSLATLVSYVAIYTPMKRVSSLNTLIGAIPGAAPPLLGYVALAGETGAWAWVLFAIILAWQFPHFMAIAWMYREDYARAGMRMLPALPDAGGIAGSQAIIYSIALLPVSLMPLFRGMAGPLYTVGALVLGIAYLAASIHFARRENLERAKKLMLVSLVYLPVLFLLILLDPAVHTALGR